MDRRRFRVDHRPDPHGHVVIEVIGWTVIVIGSMYTLKKLLTFN